MTNTEWFYIYEAPKVVKLIDTESRMVFTRGWRWGEWEIIV